MRQKNMRKIKIGVSGGKGSFSEEAGNYYCAKNNIVNYELYYLETVENVLNFLENGKVDQGVFPIENSNGGIVLEAVYAMSRHNFQIKNIFEIDIKHQLLVLPARQKEEVKKIVSHPQVLKQCRMYLKRNWSQTELEEYPDTAGAAKDLREGKLNPHSAVIASQICAKLYDLKILERDIQDLKFNFTSFIVVQKN